MHRSLIPNSKAEAHGDSSVACASDRVTDPAVPFKHFQGAGWHSVPCLQCRGQGLGSALPLPPLTPLLLQSPLSSVGLHEAESFFQLSQINM